MPDVVHVGALPLSGNPNRASTAPVGSKKIKRTSLYAPFKEHWEYKAFHRKVCGNNCKHLKGDN